MMRWLRRLILRRRIYGDLAEEIRQHFNEKVEALMADGMSRQEAEHAARRAFGNAALLEERAREAWQWPRLESIKADSMYALRQLFKSPGFSVTVIVVIALGIGANTAVFQLMRAVVSPDLPVPHPAEVYALRSIRTPNDGAWLYSGPAFDHLRRAATGEAKVAAHTAIATCNIFLNKSSGAEEARMQLVSTNFFSVLEVRPSRGRFLLDGDRLPAGGAWPVVLRYGFWQQHFAADPAILGKSFLVNGTPAIVVGVAPKRFLGVIPGNIPDFWLPLEAQKDVRYSVPFDSLGFGSGVSLSMPYRQQDALFWLTLIARVPPGSEASTTAAWTQAFQPDLELFARFTPKEQRATVLASSFTLHPLAQSEGTIFAQYARPLTVLMAMVAAVLLIAYVNLANLQSARLTARRYEFAIRASLGAGRGRILQQLLIESGMLIGVGGAMALLLAFISGPVLLHWASSGARPIPLDLHPSLEVYGFVVALLVLTFVAFGLLPAWRILQRDPAITIRSSMTVSQPQRRILSNLMLAMQVTLTLLLLSVASMFGRTLLNLNHVDTGFDRQHILTVRFAFHRAGYTEARLRTLTPQMLERLRALPGVRAAAIDMCLPPGCLWNSVLHVAGHPELSESAMQTHQDNVGSGYFRTLGIPVVKGREFEDSDTGDTRPVALVNQSLAKKLFGDADPLGRQVGFGPPPADAQFTIVGVVGNARVDGLRAQPPPVFYQPIAQNSFSIGGIAVRSSGDPLLLADAVHRGLLALDPQMPITEINSLTDDYQNTLTTEHLLVRLTSIFGGLALALAVIGIYGVLSFRVVRSTSEIGVRMALGATRADILRMVMAQAGQVFLLGGVPGVALAVVTGRLIRGLLFGVNGADGLSLCVALIVLGMAGALASFLPARRAASVDPMRALRAE